MKTLLKLGKGILTGIAAYVFLSLIYEITLVFLYVGGDYVGKSMFMIPLRIPGLAFEFILFALPFIWIAILVAIAIGILAIAVLVLMDWLDEKHPEIIDWLEDHTNLR
ncbi:MAG: hypothetical protein IJS47_04970 [Clostridia bacterium]|nr:hypothetical protein [Clostridia bacterium]